MPPHKPQPTGQNSYTFFTFVLVLAATTVLLIAGYFYYLEQKKLNASMLTEVSAVQTKLMLLQTALLKCRVTAKTMLHDASRN